MFWWRIVMGIMLTAGIIFLGYLTWTSRGDDDR